MKFDVTKCNEEQITLTTAVELAICSMKLMVEKVANGEKPEQINELWFGHPGIGKTKAAQDAFKGFLNIETLDEGIYEIVTGEKKVKAAFREIHCSNLDPTTVMVPSIDPVDSLSDKTLSLIGKAKKTTGLQKDVYKEMAVSSFGKKLSFIIEEFFEETVFGQQADCVFLLLQDINKCSDPAFNNLLKAWTDERIGHKSLPPVMCLMTANPFNSRYVNNRVDITVTTTAGVHNVTFDPFKVTDYICREMPEAKNFFIANPDLVWAEPDRDDQGSPSPRSWSALIQMTNYLIGEGKTSLIPYAASGKVGMKAGTQFCMWLVNNVKCTLNPERVLTSDGVAAIAEEILKDESINLEKFVEGVLSVPSIAPEHVYSFIRALEASPSKQKTILLWIFDESSAIGKKYKELEKRYENTEQRKFIEGVLSMYFYKIQI